MRQPNEPTARASTQMRFALLITCLREIEFIGANIKQFHANKVMALGHRKKPVKQVVSSGTPRHFHEILLQFKVNGRILANVIRLCFLKRLQSAGWSTQLRGSAGSQPVSIVVCPVAQGAEHGRESANPAKMKLARVSITISHPSRQLLLCSSSYFGAKKRAILQLPQSHPLWGQTKLIIDCPFTVWCPASESCFNRMLQTVRFHFKIV